MLCSSVVFGIGGGKVWGTPEPVLLIDWSTSRHAVLKSKPACSVGKGFVGSSTIVEEFLETPKRKGGICPSISPRHHVPNMQGIYHTFFRRRRSIAPYSAHLTAGAIIQHPEGNYIQYRKNYIQESPICPFGSIKPMYC